MASSRARLSSLLLITVHGASSVSEEHRLRGPGVVLPLVEGGEVHDALDAGAVVRAAVEQDDLAGGGQVGHVALEVPLGGLAPGRLLQRDDAAVGPDEHGIVVGVGHAQGGVVGGEVGDARGALSSLAVSGR